MMNATRASRAHFDKTLTALAFSLAAIGVLSVTVATFSTTSTMEDTIFNYIVSSHYGMRQALFFLLSPIVIGMVTYVSYNWLHRRYMLLYLISLGMLLAALGSRAISGVKAWLDVIWGFTVQPSEFVKLACIIATAKVLERSGDPLSSLKDVGRFALLLGIPWGLTIAQGEMGSVLVMVFVFGVMLFFAGIRLRILFSILIAGVLGAAAIFLWLSLSGSDSFRLVRIISALNPTAVSSDATYQVDQSKIAIGSGKMYGIGMFVQGSFSQLDYVPEDWTDFVFSTIGEAFGFRGCMIVLGLYLALILRMLYLARFTRDKFGQMIIIGVMAMLVFHVIENIGMNIGWLPVTGIPLPFLSYGGSNLVTNMAGIGLVLNVTRNRTITGISIVPKTRFVPRKYSK